MPRRSKAKHSLDEILSDSFELPDSRAELVKIYRQVAKAADTRLDRLEDYALEDNYKNALQWSYARAQRYIKEWSGPEATRFNTKPPESDQQLRQKIADIEDFLRKPSSTKEGIRSIHKQRAATLNERWGTNFTWNEVATFFDSKLKDDMYERIAGSDTLVEVIGYIQKHKKQVIKAVESANAKDLKVPDNMVGRLVQMTINDLGDEVVDYLQNKK